MCPIPDEKVCDFSLVPERFSILMAPCSSSYFLMHSLAHDSFEIRDLSFALIQTVPRNKLVESVTFLRLDLEAYISRH